MDDSKDKKLTTKFVELVHNLILNPRIFSNNAYKKLYATLTKLINEDGVDINARFCDNDTPVFNALVTQAPREIVLSALDSDRVDINPKINDITTYNYTMSAIQMANFTSVFRKNEIEYRGTRLCSDTCSVISALALTYDKYPFLYKRDACLSFLAQQNSRYYVYVKDVLDTRSNIIAGLHEKKVLDLFRYASSEILSDNGPITNLGPISRAEIRFNLPNELSRSFGIRVADAILKMNDLGNVPMQSDLGNVPMQEVQFACTQVAQEIWDKVAPNFLAENDVGKRSALLAYELGKRKITQIAHGGKGVDAENRLSSPCSDRDSQLSRCAIQQTLECRL